MNKKVKIILLSFCMFVAMAYLFRGPEWPEERLSQISVSRTPEVVDIVVALAERPWDEKVQEKFLSEVKGMEKLPKFEDFPVTEFSDNKNIAVDVNSDSIGKIYPTAIRYSVEYNGINFGGKYSVVDWGCGTGCQDGVVVDADTGHIYRLPHPTSNGYEVKKDSRLLVQNSITIPSGWMNDWFKTRYWEWNGTDFKLLGVYKVDLEKKEIIEVE
ncbi:MAG: hypothetical protein AAB941_02045 [Patescibacteria group bacterium]